MVVEIIKYQVIKGDFIGESTEYSQDHVIDGSRDVIDGSLL